MIISSKAKAFKQINTASVNYIIIIKINGWRIFLRRAPVLNQYNQNRKFMFFVHKQQLIKITLSLEKDQTKVSFAAAYP